jgi:GDSL-like Lipase/Acylhydrolase family
MAPGEIDGSYSYVALGDSISIDEYAGGPGRGGASLLARNQDDDFPHWRGRDLRAVGRGLRYHLLAADGATSRTVWESQLPRLESSGVRPSVVTLTVGGNDLLAVYGETGQARQIVRSVGVRVGEILGRIRRLMRASDDPVVVGTVYDPSDGSGDTGRVGLPPWTDVVDVLAELNAGLRGRRRVWCPDRRDSRPISRAWPTSRRSGAERSPTGGPQSLVLPGDRAECLGSRRGARQLLARSALQVSVKPLIFTHVTWRSARSARTGTTRGRLRNLHPKQRAGAPPRRSCVPGRWRTA